jgi:hypothetical protein
MMSRCQGYWRRGRADSSRHSFRNGQRVRAGLKASRGRNRSSNGDQGRHKCGSARAALASSRIRGFYGAGALTLKYQRMPPMTLLYLCMRDEARACTRCSAADGLYYLFPSPFGGS